MKTFIIISGKIAYTKKFEYSSDARTWAINHVDVSGEIIIREIESIIPL